VPIVPTLWVVSFEEHFELKPVWVLEREYRTVLELGDGRVTYAELLESSEPLIEVRPRVDFESHVIQPGTSRIEGLALIRVVLLELDDGSRRRMHEQNATPPIARGPVDFGELEYLSPPPGARLGVVNGERDVRQSAESWHSDTSELTFGRGPVVQL
jgi:hypothetical protein